MSVRAVILAAGKGTRMKSARQKVLHELCGRSMLWHVLRALKDVSVSEVVIVVNAELEPHVVAIAADAGHQDARTVVQEPQLGTGHAVQVALAALDTEDGRILVLNADMPLVGADLLELLLTPEDVAVKMVTARMPLPSNFGRVIRSGKRVERIVEQRDATPDELAVDEMNAGLYAFDEQKLRAALAELTNDNAQGEYYLTDTIGMLARSGEIVLPVVIGDHRLVLGVNDRGELAVARARLNMLLCEKHMKAGVTIVDPATTYLEPDLQIAPDVTILPNTAIGRLSVIEAHSEIGPNTRLQNARVGKHTVINDSVIVDSSIGDYALIGPWTHIRGGAVIGTGVRLGNFVEVKNSELAPGAKASHLSYLGDATIGARTNIGAGTITCNYDGKKKNRTMIGEDVAIGSNTSLVAPVSVGDGALTGAGSVVTRDVPPGGRVVGNPAKPIVPKEQKPKS
ncbi:MAG TPA: bifunctional UDP-N-acetylglucosamine diphosphorylase/glucosamine-1-phosphate N-acetyltransferase GlmU [Candidatus Baltobacteraceae bacterium]